MTRSDGGGEFRHCSVSLAGEEVQLSCLFRTTSCPLAGLTSRLPGSQGSWSHLLTLCPLGPGRPCRFCTRRARWPGDTTTSPGVWPSSGPPTTRVVSVPTKAASASGQPCKVWSPRGLTHQLCLWTSKPRPVACLPQGPPFQRPPTPHPTSRLNHEKGLGQ